MGDANDPPRGSCSASDDNIMTALLYLDMGDADVSVPPELEENSSDIWMTDVERIQSLLALVDSAVSISSENECEEESGGGASASTSDREQHIGGGEFNDVSSSHRRWRMWDHSDC